MPTTVNGIGTRYYGKRNRSVRTAACRSCNRVANLESYDTRLWFVVIFIPIIPLGRKRVIDACPICTRHFVASADAYEQARQLQVSAAQDQFRREPSTPAALQVHAALLGFHEREQATSFRQTVRERFPADAELLAGLAAQLEHAGSYPEAGELYEVAHRLQPELPEARVAVAMRKMTRGELDDARRLLDFLEIPGAGQHYPLGPIDSLSVHYQNQGRHEEALQIAAHLIREIPEAGQQHKFRAFVARSEKALGRFESILPPREHSVRGLFRGEGHVYSDRLRTVVIGSVAAILLIGGLAINNEYIRQHRTLLVVNACGAPVQVRVDDQPPQNVADTGRIVVGEGRHHIQLSGAVDEAHDVNLEAAYFDRWFCKPAWILMPGGEAALAERQVIYAKNPPPSEQHLIVGQPFVAMRHVDYLFEEPPLNMNVKNAGSQVIKSCVQRFLGPDLQVFEIESSTDRERALKFAESRLRRHPEDSKLLEAYLKSLDKPELGRAESFLKSNLDRRPVAVQWHRLFQTLAENNGHDPGLVAQYDGYLKADPRNAALIYLRGRIDPDWDRQAQHYRQAIDADPRLPWPWVALATRAAAALHWDECLRDMRKARELKIEEDVVEEASMDARMASGEAKFLVNELRPRLAANAMDFDTLRRLLEALAASGPPEDVERELIGWQNRLPMDVRNGVDAPSRAIALYEVGKLAECEEQSARSPMLRNTALRLHCLLALKRTREVADDAGFQKLFDDPFNAMAISLAWELAGQKAEADRWSERTAKALDSRGADERRLATILRATQPPSLDVIPRLAYGAGRQAMICALLAERFPAKRADFLATAAKYNVRRVPPYQLVKVAIETRPTAESKSAAAR